MTNVDKNKLLNTRVGDHINYFDNGIGLSAESKDNIFEPFYTTKRGKGGSGLGAHIVYNLVTQRLQGNIGLDEEREQGVGFKIKFPLTIT